MSGAFTAACVQLTAGHDIAPRTSRPPSARARCARAGPISSLTAGVRGNASSRTAGSPTREGARRRRTHPGLAAFRALAREHRASGCWSARSTDHELDAATRLANRSFLIDPTGAVVARYDKIHMFDVDLPGGESYRESATYRPGDAAPWSPTRRGAGSA